MCIYCVFFNVVSDKCMSETLLMKDGKMSDSVIKKVSFHSDTQTVCDVLVHSYCCQVIAFGHHRPTVASVLFSAVEFKGDAFCYFIHCIRLNNRIICLYCISKRTPV